MPVFLDNNQRIHPVAHFNRVAQAPRLTTQPDRDLIVRRNCSQSAIDNLLMKNASPCKKILRRKTCNHRKRDNSNKSGQLRPLRIHESIVSLFLSLHGRARRLGSQSSRSAASDQAGSDASALQLFLSAAAEDIAQRELKLARVIR